MDTQQSLPYRVLGSARGLACSTFSGVAGIEAELRDPRNGKQHSVTRVRKPGFAEADVKGQRQRQRKRSSAGNSKAFRAKPSASVARQADEAFEQFQTHSSTYNLEASSLDFETQRLNTDLDHDAHADGLGGLWMDSRNARDEEFRSDPVSVVVPSIGGVRMANTISPSDPWDSTMTCEDFQEGPCAYQEGTLDDKELQLSFATDEDTFSNSRIGLDVHQPDWSTQRKELTSHSTASRRLDQIESHLMRFSNLELGINDQTQHTRGRMDSMLYQQSQHQQLQVNHASRTAQHATRDEASYDRGAQQGKANARHIHQPQKPTKGQGKTDDEPEERLFRCPYFDCHRRLQQIQASQSSQTSKPCVHTGCDFLADSTSTWVEHVVSPHHDIQGGPSPAVKADLENIWAHKARVAGGDVGANDDENELMET